MEKRTLGKNLRLVFGTIWKADRLFLWKKAAEVAVKILTPFLAAALPSLVIWMLEQYGGMGRFAAGIAAVFAVSGAALGAGAYLYQANKGNTTAVRCKTFLINRYRKAISLDYGKFESPEIREAEAKADFATCGHTGTGVEFFVYSFGDVLVSVGGIVLYACIATGIHPLIVVMLIAISLIQMGAARLARKCETRQKQEKARIVTKQEYIGKQAFDVPAGKDIRLFLLDEWLEGLYGKLNRRMLRLLRKEKGMYFLADLTGIVLQFLRDAVCFWYLLLLMAKGMPASRFVLYLGIISGFGAWFTQLGDALSMLLRTNTHVQDLRNYMEIKNEFLHGEGETLPGLTAFGVEFSHVGFAYPGSETKILDDVSFSIRPGERLALVGSNGAGKSTIVKLLCGFYRPTEGKILVGGKDITALDMDWYMAHIAAVFQKSLVLSFSIAENVSGKPPEQTDAARCEKALRLAGLWDKVDSLPRKTDTCLGKEVEEDGISLSGGELQKLMLARALYQGASLLLLDEPTAALDAIAESEMYERYGTLLEGKTALFISHRLASTRFCDRILFLKDGKIAEEGTHGELMRRGGLYREMFDVQSKYYREGGMRHETA